MSFLDGSFPLSLFFRGTLSLCFTMKAASALFLVAFEPMAHCAGLGFMPFRQTAKQQIQPLSKPASTSGKSIKSSWSAAAATNSSLVLDERGWFSDGLASLSNRELECAVGQCKMHLPCSYADLRLSLRVSSAFLPLCLFLGSVRQSRPVALTSSPKSYVRVNSAVWMEAFVKRQVAVIPEQSRVALEDATLLKVQSAVLRPRPTVPKVITVRARARPVALMARLCAAKTDVTIRRPKPAAQRPRRTARLDTVVCTTGLAVLRGWKDVAPMVAITQIPRCAVAAMDPGPVRLVRTAWTMASTAARRA